jgi:hypothetical protein
MPPIADPDVQILANCSLTLQRDYADEDKEWAGSPFAWIKTRPSRQVGTIGEKLVSGWLATKGFDVARSPDSDADRLVNGVRAEIKFSTLWKNGSFKFQQLRDQNYKFAICLGICPFDAYCWILPKELILAKWRANDGIESQHGGQDGSDTAWLTVEPGKEPGWLRECGGRLSSAAARITVVTGKKPI